MVDSVEAKKYVLNEEISELGAVVEYNKDGKLCLIKTNMTLKDSGSNKERVVSYFIERRLNAVERMAEGLKNSKPYANFEDLFFRATRAPTPYQLGMSLEGSFPPP